MPTKILFPYSIPIWSYVIAWEKMPLNSLSLNLRRLVTLSLYMVSYYFLLLYSLLVAYFLSITGEVTWSSFQTVIERVVAAIEAECVHKFDPPALLTLMNQPNIVDRNLVSLGASSTTYRDNFNRNEEIQFNAGEEFRYEQTREEMGSNLDKAARVLAAGTTKVTHHVPGFRGHIPMNTRNERKLEHSVAKTLKPVQNDLVLTQRGMGCVLGYTGHVPIEFNGPRLERKTSCDPRTSNGAAYSGKKALL